MTVLVSRMILSCAAISMALGAGAADTSATQQLVSANKADTWVATDGLGRHVEQADPQGIRDNKYVGMFYFIWQGAHGHDHNSGVGKNGGVMAKKDSDTSSPYDITQMLKENPEKPQYGPLGAFHYWGEPYFGYYLGDDEWVIRKHAQMLSDAGVDCIFIDITNAVVYVPQIKKICEIYKQMRKEGNSTPSISFVLNSNAEGTVNNLYNQIYKKDQNPELWFLWQGKPLVLCDPAAIKGEAKNYFTARQSWAWTKGQQWFADGKDKWAWLDHSPQTPGWHESPDKPEEISVAIAQHPISNIGRSHKNGKQPKTPETAKGIYFQEQWDNALKTDPELVFVTGWNEWIAMRFNDGKAGGMLGKKIQPGDDYFVDLYNAEYSRDAEPAKDSEVSDNYYYQLINNIRKFKGSRPQPKDISVSEKLDDLQAWKDMGSIYIDDAGDTLHRNHAGWGRIKEYINTSGRNDIIEARVASNDKQIGFYVKTKEKISPLSDKNRMQLLVWFPGNSNESLNGFQYMIQETEPGKGSVQQYDIVSSTNNPWKAKSSCKVISSDNEIVFVIEKDALEIPANKPLNLDFKWQDNVEPWRNPMKWYDQGDTAPNGRFRYRYIREM